MTRKKMERKQEAMKNEIQLKKVFAAINEWKDASESRKVFAVLEDEDGNMAIIGKGKGANISLARALNTDERMFSTCKSALELVTLAKNTAEANAKEHMEE